MARVLLGVMIAVFILMGLIPPWVQIERGIIEQLAGYFPIFAPPPLYNNTFGVELDVKRLLVQWVSVGAIIGLLWLRLRRKQRTPAQRQAPKSE